MSHSYQVLVQPVPPLISSLLSQSSLPNRALLTDPLLDELHTLPLPTFNLTSKSVDSVSLDGEAGHADTEKNFERQP